MGKQLKRGRKPLKDKVKPLTIYVKESAIKAKGGSDACRERLKKFFDSIRVQKYDTYNSGDERYGG